MWTVFRLITSISCPTLSTPRRMLPPATPPFKSWTSHPGLLTSNDLITISLGSAVKSRTGIGIFLVIYSQSTYATNQFKKWNKRRHPKVHISTSILYFSCADMGIIGAPSATVPCTNFTICSCCSFAWPSFTKSILFCRIRMFFNFIISMAAKCSLVCGWGQDSLPKILQTLHWTSHYCAIFPSSFDCFVWDHTFKNYFKTLPTFYDLIIFKLLTDWYNKWFIHTSNKEQCSIHNSSTVQHGSHENVVTGAVDKADMTHQLEAAWTTGTKTRKRIILWWSPRNVTSRPRAL